MPDGANGLRVLCVGDRFITADSLARSARDALGPDTHCVCYQTEWPDEPFGDIDGVREASGVPSEVAARAADADVLLTHLGPVTAEVIAAASSLRIVGSTRGGPVNVDLAAATATGIPVSFLPGRNLNAVAEFTIGVMVALPRGIHAAARSLATGRWDPSFFRFDQAGPELRACTVGIVGAGAVGLRVAELAGAFGATVVAHDPFADVSELRARGIEPVGLDRLLEISDVVSVHARLTDQTRRMFDADTFARMKPGAYLINTARGELVDQGALRDALLRGHLGGAALDVFDPEPPAPDDPLLAMPNVLPTPHLAGSSRQVATLSAQRVAAAAERFLRTGELDHCANPRWRDRVTTG